MNTYHFGFAPFNRDKNQIVDLVPNGVYLAHTRPGDGGIPVTLHQLPSGRFVFYRTLVASTTNLLGWASTPTWRTVSLLRESDGGVIEQAAQLDFDLLERVRPGSIRMAKIRAASMRPSFNDVLSGWLEGPR